MNEIEELKEEFRKMFDIDPEKKYTLEEIQKIFELENTKAILNWIHSGKKTRRYGIVFLKALKPVHKWFILGDDLLEYLAKTDRGGYGN